jgi:hypothetical protein
MKMDSSHNHNLNGPYDQHKEDHRIKRDEGCGRLRMGVIT